MAISDAPGWRSAANELIALRKRVALSDSEIARLTERIRTLEAGIEREAEWCEEIAEMDLDPTEASDSNLKRAGRLRALLETPK